MICYPMLSMKYVLLLMVSVALFACSDAPEPEKEVMQKPISKPGVDESKRESVISEPVVKPGEITAVQIDQLFMMQQSEGVYLIDVRPPLFFHLGHIDGAVNLPLIRYKSALPKHLSSIEQALKGGKAVVLYCQNVNCPDAYKTARKLAQLGHSVSVYKGGWQEWKKSGL